MRLENTSSSYHLNVNVLKQIWTLTVRQQREMSPTFLSLYVLPALPRVCVCARVCVVCIVRAHVCFHIHYANLCSQSFSRAIFLACACLCVSVCILSSRCVVTGCLGNRHILRRPFPATHPPHFSHGSKQRLELRCQEGHFRDDNSPPAQTRRTFVTWQESYKHTLVALLSMGRASTALYTSLVRLSLSLFLRPVFQLLSLLLFVFPLYLIKLFLLREVTTGSPLGVSKVSHYRSDISETDVGAASGRSLAPPGVNIRMS